MADARYVSYACKGAPFTLGSRFARVSRGLSQVFIALFAAFPALACENATILQSPLHLELGVRFSTHDPRVVEQASRALKRWSEIADMSWHRDDTNQCSIDIDDGTSAAWDEIAEANIQEGSITFASADELTAHELFITAFHEIGHLFGLQHNPSPQSVMYWIDIRGDEVLDGSDMRALAATHALRAGSICSERASCEILSDAFPRRKLVYQSPSSGIAMAASQSTSPRATRSRRRHHRVRPHSQIKSR
jgi:Matrixin